MSLKLFDLSGKVALITGSGRGLGFAIAEGLAAAGATIILNDIDEERLERQSKLCSKKTLKRTDMFSTSLRPSRSKKRSSRYKLSSARSISS